MITASNTDNMRYDVMQIVNESPVGKRGGVATVAEALHRNLLARSVRSLFVVVDHSHTPQEMNTTLEILPHVMFASVDDLARVQAPISHSHAYRYSHGLLEHAKRSTTIATLHSLAAAESSGLPGAYGDDIAGQISLMRNAAAVALVSAAEFDRYVQLGYSRVNPRARVVHNGVPVPKEPSRRRLGRKGTLGYCGRIVARKNPEYLLRVLTERRFSKTKVMIAGRPFTRSLEQWLAIPGVGNRVDLLGWCGGPRLERFFAEIDVLVVPSSYEPSGLVALEASLRGVPVVCTRVDGLTETMGEHAFYAESDRYEDVLIALNAWADADPADLSVRTAKARDRAVAMFSAEAMTSRYQALYAHVASLSSPG